MNRHELISEMRLKAEVAKAPAAFERATARTTDVDGTTVKVRQEPSNAPRPLRRPATADLCYRMGLLSGLQPDGNAANPQVCL